MTLHVICALALVLLGPPEPGGVGEGDVISLPLEEGRLHVRDVLETVCRNAGLDPGERFRDIDWTIDVGSALGRFRLRVLERLFPGSVAIDVREQEVVITIDRAALASQGRELLAGIEQRLGETGDAPRDPPYGVTMITREDRRAPLEALPPDATRPVLLVHGLDDPGWMWRDVAPALLEAGHVVLRFEYPNDQPIADSADFLATCLQDLRGRGVERVDVVAHSMGGLVTRDVLTRRAYYDGDGTGEDRFPAVDRLIMLGTPNHGSPMARVRAAAELAEMISRWLEGGGSWTRALDDGGGEAGEDLLPGSTFLQRLNGRPPTGHTTYTIVAGRVSPLSETEIAALLEGTEGEDAAEPRASKLLQAAVRGIGDGVVSLASAQLEGVTDVVVVEADHLGMIVNVLPSDDVPPAIPVILDRLTR